MASVRPSRTGRSRGCDDRGYDAEAIRVVAAEDSYLIREGLRLLLATQPDLYLVATTASLPELLAAVATHAPDVVVTDVRDAARSGR